MEMQLHFVFLQIAMAFWGVKLKPAKSYTHNFEKEQGRLHISQATLESGSTSKKCIVQCKVGDKEPIYVCSLLPEKLETCPLNLEFEEDEDVTFSVIGSHIVHLSGFFYGESKDCCGDEYGSDPYEDDAVETESESDDLFNFDFDTEDEDEDCSTDDDISMYPAPRIRNSGVKIEEIREDEKPTVENGTSKKPKKKKNQPNGTDDIENSEHQIVVKGYVDSPLLDSEDEDGFPISAPPESKAKSVRSKLKSDGNKDQDTREEAPNEKARDSVDERKGLKKRVRDDNIKDNNDQRGDNDKQNKKNKKKKVVNGELLSREDVSKSNVNAEHVEDNDEAVSVGKMEDGLKLTNQKDIEKKKKKKKNKKNQQDDKAVVEVEQHKKNESHGVEEDAGTEPSRVKTFGNGLVIEEVAMGKPDGKKATPGKKVGVHYIGKLKKNGKIFDSNIGRRPFEFRLGIGQVIKGWDVGVNGMRIGDKRRITIPPSMGYGSKAAGDIPPNSWLAFDVELVNVG